MTEGRFSAEEITEAYAELHRRVQGYVDAGDWTGFAESFTEDAVYVEHAYGTFRGREEIRAWSTRTMTTFPGGVMTGFPLAWQVVDVPTSRLICEVRNLMPDPGDGSVPSTSSLNYQAGLNRANNAMLPLASNGDGTLGVAAFLSGGGTIDVIVDVNGYYK